MLINGKHGNTGDSQAFMYVLMEIVLLTVCVYVYVCVVCVCVVCVCCVCVCCMCVHAHVNVHEHTQKRNVEE